MPAIKKCKSCEARVFWVRMADSQKAMMVDAEPTPGGKLRVRGSIATVVSEGGTHTSHFATCPEADSHRAQHRKIEAANLELPLRGRR